MAREGIMNPEPSSAGEAGRGRRGGEKWGQRGGEGKQTLEETLEDRGVFETSFEHCREEKASRGREAE